MYTPTVMLCKQLGWLIPFHVIISVLQFVKSLPNLNSHNVLNYDTLLYRPRWRVNCIPYRPQSGQIRLCCISPIRPYPPGKTAVFLKKNPYFSRIDPYKKYEPLIGVQYIKLKPTRSSIKYKRNHFVLTNSYA